MSKFKIADIEIIPLTLKPVKPDWGTNNSLDTANLLVLIKTDDGLTGYGEAASGPAYFNQTFGSLLDWLNAYAVALIGHDVRDIIGAHKIMDGVSGEHPPGTQPARCGIDLALHDLAGKLLDVPVYQLLGGQYRTRFEMLTNLYELTPEAKASAAKEFVDAGYTGLKTKVGAATKHGISKANLEIEKEKLIATLDAVPDHIYVDADSNQSWGTVKNVISIVEELFSRKHYKNLSIEQPLNYLDLAGHAYLRSVLKVPLIIDEPITSPAAVLQAIRMGAMDRIVLKISRVGGLLPARRIAAICEAASVGISLDTMPFTKLGDTANCHLAATLRDHYPIDVDGHLWFEKTPYVGGLTMIGGHAEIDDAPGFGVELDKDLLDDLRRAAD